MIVLRLTQCLKSFNFTKFEANGNVISESEYNTLFDEHSTNDTYGVSYADRQGNIIHLTTL